MKKNGKLIILYGIQELKFHFNNNNIYFASK